MTPTKGKNRAAAALGRKGGKNRAAKLTPEKRSEAARKAVTDRWAQMTPEQRSEHNRQVALKGWETRRKREEEAK